MEVIQLITDKQEVLISVFFYARLYSESMGGGTFALHLRDPQFETLWKAKTSVGGSHKLVFFLCWSQAQMKWEGCVRKRAKSNVDPSAVVTSWEIGEQLKVTTPTCNVLVEEATFFHCNW